MSRKIQIFFLLFLLISTLPVSSKVFFLEADYYQDKTQERKIILGKGEVISSDKSIVRIAVSDPNISDLQVLSEKQIFVRAKQLGTCTILVWERDKSAPTRFDIAVWPDIDYLAKQLNELDKNITVEYIPPTTTVSDGASSGGGLGGAPSSASPQGPSGGLEASGGASASGAGAPAATSGAATSGPQLTSGKIILKGEVENAEIIARALQIAGAYVGDQGIKIISHPGGQVVDGLAGRYDIYSNSDSQATATGQGSATSFGARDPIRFTSNKFANLSRGIIATTQRGSVISFLTVKNPPQVSVAIRFYEVSRTLTRNLGLNTTFGGSTLQGGSFVGGNGVSQILGQIGSIANLMDFMAATGGAAPEFSFTHGSIAGGSAIAQTLGQGVTGVIFNPDNGIGVVIQALQERGEIKTLAEPNLVIANGEPASFLAGGEVPIVRSVFTAGGASQDITYEPFGIKFTLLPTVTGKNRIYLQLVPEIRDIDTELSNFVVPPGSTAVRPPAFKTRRTQTQVELESGQAFAISGLLREDNTRSLRKVPGIGDIPILGTLFRSKSFRKGDTELLVVVSPQIVRPTSSNKIAQLSIPEAPLHEFDQFAQLRPHAKLKDKEYEPDMKIPLNAGKYNAPPESEETRSFNKSLRNIVPESGSIIKKSEVRLRKPISRAKENAISLRPEVSIKPLELEAAAKKDEKINLWQRKEVFLTN